MIEDFIDVYGGYTIKILKLQSELLQALDRHRVTVKPSRSTTSIFIWAARGWSALWLDAGDGVIRKARQFTKSQAVGRGDLDWISAAGRDGIIPFETVAENRGAL
jgi:hypothetical protein